jgi:AraC-like DNA-binding protein
MKTDGLLKLKEWEALARIAGYSIEPMAARHGVSARHLRRSFEESQSGTLRVWLHELRMADALRMLTPGSSIKEVSHLLGYENRHRFTEAFQRFYGKTPSDYLDGSDNRAATADEVAAFIEYVSKRRKFQPSVLKKAKSALQSGVHWESMGRLSRYSAARLSQQCSVSSRHLRRYFRDAFGIGLKEWLHDLRMRDAGRLLHPEQPIRNTWTILGYREPNSFWRHFKAYFDRTPAQYLKNRKKMVIEIESFAAQYLEVFK